MSVYRCVCVSENVLVGVYKQNYLEQLNVKDPKRLQSVQDIREVQQIVKNVFLQNLFKNQQVRALHSLRAGEFLALTEQSLCVFSAENRVLFTSGEFGAQFAFAASAAPGGYAALQLSPESLQLTEISPIDAE